MRGFFFAGASFSLSSSSLDFLKISFFIVSRLPSASYNAQVLSSLLYTLLAHLHKQLLQTGLSHELVGERADLGRLFVFVFELFDVRVRRVEDDERFECPLFPLEDGDRAFAAHKLARELALALAVGGDVARRALRPSALSM